jgi:hypothetical protein
MNGYGQGAPVRMGGLYRHQMAEAKSATDAWARLVLMVIPAPVDPSTLSSWAGLIATSPDSLRQRCYAAGAQPRRSLLLARTLRAVMRSQGGPWNPSAWLRAAEPRTLRRLLRDTGLPTQGASTPTPNDFLLRQQFLAGNHPALVALALRIPLASSPEQMPQQEAAGR